MIESSRSISSLPGLLARLWPHLGKRRQRQFVLLFGLNLVSAIAEVASLGAVVPFLGLLTAPEVFFKQPILASLAQSLGITSPDQLILPLTIAFAVAALVAGAIRMLLLWASTRVAFASGSDISIGVYRRTLYQPYQVHIARNSSEIISGITTKVAGAVNVLYNSLTILSSTVLLLAIGTALFAFDPQVALASMAVFGLGYGLIAWSTRRRLHRNSHLIAREQTNVVKALQEGLGGIRDVLLDGTQEVYCDVYRKADQPLRRTEGNNNFIGGFPRFVMEAIGMILIAVLAYALSRRTGGLSASMPTLGALVLGAQRMLPMLQNGYAAWSAVASNQSLLADVIHLLDQPIDSESVRPAPPTLRFAEAIRFQDVRFRYNERGPWILDGMNLVIRKGSRIGIVGSTGSGKSTTLDLLMGLLRPVQGQLRVDDTVIDSTNVRGWQRNIAHVPQAIFLADTSLAENIAFGVPPKEIDRDRLIAAARQAQIASFIESSPHGYQQVVGERGVRLSGGQRQRIGIARALYKQATVLILDEATSALDNMTEQSVMSSIEGLSRDLTILIVAHRISTVRLCDTIVELRQGKVVAQGTYDELLELSPSFRQIAAPTA